MPALPVMNPLETSLSRKICLGLQCLLLFVGVPAVYASGRVAIPISIIPLLLLITSGCWCVLRWRYQISLAALLRRSAPAAEWRRILLTCAIVAPCLIGLLWAIKPELLLALPLKQTRLWLLIMIAYPLVSVLPQELIYRVFFFERYRPIFGQGLAMTAASAAMFGWGHIVFHNWLAVLLTLPGGWLFATTFRRTGSLRVVAIEHALYGCAIFTIGYGSFFYEGTLRLFRHWPAGS